MANSPQVFLERRRSLPRAFTEFGAPALSMILKSARAVAASREIIRAFVRLRRVFNANHSLARKVEELAEQVGDHRKAIAIIFQEIESLTQSPEPPRERIGFKTNKERGVSGKARKG